MEALGIDIGGSGIKGAIVETRTGKFLSERVRFPTPANPGPDKLIPVIEQLLAEFKWNRGAVGIGFPGVMKSNVIHSAVNLSPSLVGLNLAREVKGLKACKTVILNDADAAGYAEMKLGVGKDHQQDATVLLLTIGTGIGSVLFRNGMLIPNMELGHIEHKGVGAEQRVSERARKLEDLTWKRWGKRFNAFLHYIEFLIQPDLIILGGGGVKKTEKFKDCLDIETPWEIAHFGNRAGIIGAAVAAADA